MHMGRHAAAAILLTAIAAGHAMAQDQVRTSYKTFALKSSGHDAVQSVVTDLRNMLPKAYVYYVEPAQAISVRGSDEDVQLAGQILAEVDKPVESWKLTYIVTTIEDGKRGPSQQYQIVAATLSQPSHFRQGTKLPIVTGTSEDKNTQVQYIDVGISLEATLTESASGLLLHSKIEESRVAEEKANASTDPVIAQRVLESSTTLIEGKPQIIGLVDVPGTGRREEIAVVATR